MSGRKRRKKKKFGYYLYAVVSLSLFIINIGLGSILLFHVQGVEVIGNTYSSQAEALQMVNEDPNTSNALYFLWKIKSGSYEKPAYLEAVDVRLLAPWKVQLQLTEKPIMGCAIGADGYVYFDKDGLVLLIDPELMPNVPVVEGIDTKEAQLYETIQGDYQHLFRSISQLTSALSEKELYPDRLVWEDDSMNAYFERVCVRFGKSGYEEKVLQFTAIRKELDGKDGILHLEHYGETNKSISFEKNY